MSRDELEQAILDVTENPRSPIEIREALLHLGISPWEQDLRDAIWSLIHFNKLRLLNDRRGTEGGSIRRLGIRPVE